MFIIQILAKLFKILQSEGTPNQIAAGFVMGMVVGLTPLWTVHNVILFILIVILKVNIGAALFAFVVFSGLAWLFDPLFHSLGYFLLVDMSSLKGIWTFLYNFPVIALSRYNNTVVIGSLAAALLLIVPMFPFAKYFVHYYRKHIDPRLQKLKIVKIIKGSTFYNIYQKIRGVTQ